MNVFSLEWIDVFRFGVDIALKTGLVVLFTWLLSKLLRRRAASVRGLLWTYTLLVITVVPFLSLVMPEWNLSVLPEIQNGADDAEFSRVVQNMNYTYSASVNDGSIDSIIRDLHSIRPQKQWDHPWSKWMVWIWLAGAFIYAGWLLVGHFGIVRMVRTSDPMSQNWYNLSRVIAGRFGVRCKVRLVRTGQVTAAITVGVRRPVILLPAQAEMWAEKRRQVVLAHELAHIQRKDARIEIIVKFASVFHWFNPLFWFGLNRLRIERERACDDLVLMDGTKPSDYASELMEVAADLGAFRRPLWQAAVISQGSGLKDRLLCILDPRVRRRENFRNFAVSIGLMLGLMIWPLASFGLWSADNLQPLPGIKMMKLPKEKIPKIVEMLTAEKESQRQKARESLQQIHFRQMYDVVGAALSSKNVDARQQALDIMLIRDERKTEIMLKQLAEKGKPSQKKIVSAELERIKKRPSIHSMLNGYGYKLINENKLDKAVEVFKLNVQAFPESSNAYDSLAEAYMLQKKWDMATENYQKSLKLNPDNVGASEKISKIEHLRKMKGQPRKYVKKDISPGK